MNEAFDLNLKKWVYADRRYKHRPDAIPYSDTNAHHEYVVSETDYRAVGFKPRTDKRRAHFYKIPGKTHNPNGGGQMTYLHRLGRDYFFERLINKEEIKIGLRSYYICEFDTKCGYCDKIAAPKKNLLNLNYYDEIFKERASFLYPEFRPDILLRNSRTGEELWIEINTENAIKETPEKIYTGIPIFERDCVDSTDLSYISKLSTMYDGNHCRIYNAWNLPVYNGVEINCQKFLKLYNRKRPQHILMYIHPDGRRIKAKKGKYGWIPIINGEWHTIKEVTEQGFVLREVEEEAAD